MMRNAGRVTSDAPDTPADDPERLLLALGDHLHEHCECRPGSPRCAACDLRHQLRGMREELLAWRAEGRRLGTRRADAIANGAEHAALDGDHCATCRALTTLARSVSR